MGFGLLGPALCWISFRSRREEQSDPKPEMMDSEDLARDQPWTQYCSVLMQLLPAWFWQDFLTQKEMNCFPKNHSPPANLDSPQVGLWQCLKTIFLKIHFIFSYSITTIITYITKQACMAKTHHIPNSLVKKSIMKVECFFPQESQVKLRHTSSKGNLGYEPTLKNSISGSGNMKYRCW